MKFCVLLDRYDFIDRLRKALRGELSDDGGHTATGGGSITTPISLPNTATSRDYDLDGLGNWKQSDYIPVGGTATIDLRQHNKLNEITSRKVGDDTKVLFAYDGTTGASNGNLADDGTLMLSYDAFNRLIQVKRKSDGATIGQYVYDALNRRTRKTVSNGGLSGDIPNGTTDYIYQNWQAVEERSSSTTLKQFIWGRYIDECVQLKTLTTTGPQSLPASNYYPLQDLLYRTTALTDSIGEIVEAYDYDAYGNTLIFSAAGTDNDWWADDATQANYGACEVLYCGYRYDPESKLYQVRNREYYPVLGRWLQRDPIGFDGGDWNLYGYVGNNPVMATDPEGKVGWVLIFVVGVGLIWVLSGCNRQPPPPPRRPNINDICGNEAFANQDGCWQMCSSLAAGEGQVSDADALTCCQSIYSAANPGNLPGPSLPGLPTGPGVELKCHQMICDTAGCGN